jgi:hypothetical protein
MGGVHPRRVGGKGHKGRGSSGKRSTRFRFSKIRKKTKLYLLPLNGIDGQASMARGALARSVSEDLRGLEVASKPSRSKGGRPKESRLPHQRN